MLGCALVMEKPRERPEELAALELLYGTGTRDVDRWIAWVISDVMRQWGMPLPWPIDEPGPQRHDANHQSSSA